MQKRGNPAGISTARILFEGYQASSKQNQPLADLLRRAQVFPTGDRVTLRLSVNEDEASSLPTILSASNFAK